MDATFNVLRKLGAPPAYSRSVMEQLAEATPLPRNASFANPFFTRAIKDKHGRRLPQCIAHRGYKAKYPENTMAAFRGAVEAGVHALETDVHISKDDVVVLSHDISLQRCFGVDMKINECDWKSLNEIRTIQKPHEGLPRLEDLLQFLTQPGRENIWVLIDVKLNNDPERIMRLMSETLSRVPPSQGTRWENRIIFGCWAARYMSPCVRYLPNFPVANIGFSVAYSRQFLNRSLAHMALNMRFSVLVSPSGQRMIRRAKAMDRTLYAWTVNDENGWRWCIDKQLDGVITDDPQSYLDFCRQHERELESDEKQKGFSLEEIKSFTTLNIFMWLFEVIFRICYGFDAAEKLLSHNAGSGR